MNGQYNSRKNNWRVKTACTALALQGLESRDSYKGFKILGQVQTTTKTQYKSAHDYSVKRYSSSKNPATARNDSQNQKTRSWG